MWFSDTLMGGMTQALRTRPSVGARRQGNRVLGLLSPSDRPRLCNKDTNSLMTREQAVLSPVSLLAKGE